MPQLFYTYDFINEEPGPVNMNFFDGLPDGLVWNTAFTPVTTNGLSVNVVYSNNNRDATITEFAIPSGNIETHPVHAANATGRRHRKRRPN